MVRSVQVTGQMLGVHRVSAGSSWKRDSTLCRSIARSNVTLMGASPGTLPSPLCGETSSIAGAEGLHAPRPIAATARTARTVVTWAGPVTCHVNLGLNTRATLSKCAAGVGQPALAAI